MPTEEPKLTEKVSTCIAEGGSGKHDNDLTKLPITCKHSLGYVILDSTRKQIISDDFLKKDFYCPHMGSEETRMDENGRTRWHYRPCNIGF